MKIPYSSCFLLLGLITLISCDSSPIDPTFDSVQRFKHELFSNEADCFRRQSQNAEFSCVETVTFNPDGKAETLLGGGDLVVGGTYKRTKKMITINLVHKIGFQVVSDTELVMIGANTKWVRY